MKNVIIIGANGRPAREIIPRLAGQDIVIVGLGSTDLDVTIAAVVAAAETIGTHRIITISAGGIYGELPEPFNTWDYEMVGDTRPVHREAADVVEQSSLGYTTLRQVWLTDKDVTEVELTRKGEVHKGTETSRASIGEFIAGIIASPGTHLGENLGITQPGTDGDRPAAYR